MSTHPLTGIVAMTETGVIGAAGKLPWRLPEDLRRFKQVTMGNTVIMGRKTWESLPGALPGRLNIVLTRNEDAQFPGALAVSTLDAAIERSQGIPFIIGGAEIFRLALPRIERWYVTQIHQPFEGDTYFPEVDWDFFQIKETSGIVSEPFPHTYRVWERRWDR